MPTEAACPADAPVMKAWEAYKKRDEFQNTRRWALYEAHVEGSLWAAFYQGFFAAAVNISQSAGDDYARGVADGREQAAKVVDEYPYSWDRDREHIARVIRAGETK